MLPSFVEILHFVLCEYLKSSEHTHRLIKPGSIVSMNNEEQQQPCEGGKGMCLKGGTHREL